MIDASVIDGLAAAVKAALLPQRFPMRRDVEFAAAADSGATAFYDYLWLGKPELALIAVRIADATLAGALTAAAVKQLIRAALAKLRDPEAALASLRATIPEARGCDAALAVIDVETGRTRSAQQGDAAVEAGAKLGPGDLLWLRAGAAALPGQAAVPIEGLGALVEPAAKRAGSGAVVAALLFKKPARASNTATIVLSNDAAEIPEAMREVERFCARQAIDEADTFGLDVALDEVLSNSVLYGFKDGARHEIHMELTAEPTMLRIEVRDDGTPFDPLSVPEPDLAADLEHRAVGGLGMHFVRNILDTVSYRRHDGWNVLLLEKRLGRAAETTDGQA